MVVETIARVVVVVVRTVVVASVVLVRADRLAVVRVTMELVTAEDGRPKQPVVP